MMATFFHLRLQGNLSFVRLQQEGIPPYAERVFVAQCLLVMIYQNFKFKVCRKKVQEDLFLRKTNILLEQNRLTDYK